MQVRQAVCREKRSALLKGSAKVNTIVCRYIVYIPAESDRDASPFSTRSGTARNSLWGCAARCQKGPRNVAGRSGIRQRVSPNLCQPARARSQISVSADNFRTGSSVGIGAGRIAGPNREDFQTKIKMHLIRTAIIFDRGEIHRTDGWRCTYDAFSMTIREMVNPTSSDSFRIRVKTRKKNANGEYTNQWNRNGVGPIKEQFQRRMTDRGWVPEEPLALSSYFQSDKVRPYQLYPSLNAEEIAEDVSVGDFDFWFRTNDGVRTAIEWETGNISSSHRSVNKLCMALSADLIDAAVLFVPSRETYPHLTDRIGNWNELRPYVAFWQTFGGSLDKGLLAIAVWEHDELVQDDSIPYIEQGRDGRSAEGKSKTV